MQVKSVDLRKTVNLPQTKFNMKANLPQTEPHLLARWEQQDLYGQLRETRAGLPMYQLHDGPPYANGDIHLGHAFNKILKDFIVKSKSMAGFDAPYIPGWDCHGLPIEIKVDAQLGSKKAQMTVAQIRQECRKYAAKYVEAHRRDFKRLGIFGRWDDPYLTMSPKYEGVIASALVDFIDQGYVYKGLKPVHWCIRDRTALAEAEVEYENHTSPSVWVRFPLTSDPAEIAPELKDRTVYGLIWTTTPWTLPANLGIAYHPRFVYAAVEAGDAVYLVAEDLLGVTAETCGWRDPRVLAKFAGEKLEHTVYRHPFLDRDSVGILADYVTLEQGTGAVHTAPGHGHEDYVTGQKYGLPVYCPVNAEGRFVPAEGAAGVLPEEILGKTIWDANPIVVGILRDRGALLAERKVEHSYPHCWRCHNATIFRATDQWFIGMERNDLRQRALEAIHSQVKWYPTWGEDRIANMIEFRPDWCISRQRVWGVPICVFYCEGCGEAVTDRKVLDRVVDLFTRHSSDIWYEKTARELMGQGYECARCGSGDFRKETDILDVWFDSGSSHLAVLNEEEGLPWPADLYLEGGDQYRGWFHSSLLIGVGLKGRSPYRGCLSHGWTLDGEGRAMSKSVGNTIDPGSIIKQYGADVLRLWVASVEYTEDVRLSDVILTRLSEAYRKIRNTFRYALGNLYDFDPAQDALPADDLLEMDQWILTRAESLIARCLVWYDEFAFHKVYQAVYGFATTDLSSLYFDVLKDRLYASAPKSRERRSAQTALYRLSHALVRLFAPVLSFTTEEVWNHLPKPPDAAASVHLAVFPLPEEMTDGLSEESRSRLSAWNTLVAVREAVLKPLETARQNEFIGASLQARIRLQVGGDLASLLERYRNSLPELFIVSEVELEPGSATTPEEVEVEVEKATGVKCERCWRYTHDVGADAEFPTVCVRCAEAVRSLDGAGE